MTGSMHFETLRGVGAVAAQGGRVLSFGPMDRTSESVSPGLPRQAGGSQKGIQTEPEWVKLQQSAAV